MPMHNAVYWGDQLLPSKGTRLGGVIWPPPTILPPFVSRTSFQVLCPSKQPLVQAGWIDSWGWVRIMGTRIAGVDIMAYKNNKTAFSGMLIHNKQALEWTFRIRVKGSSSATLCEELLPRKECRAKAKSFLYIKNVQQATSVIFSTSTQRSLYSVREIESCLFWEQSKSVADHRHMLYLYKVKIWQSFTLDPSCSGKLKNNEFHVM